MVAQTCTCSTDANANRVPILLGTEPIRLIVTFNGEYIFKKFTFRREHIVTITDYTVRALAISSRTSS